LEVGGLLVEVVHSASQCPQRGLCDGRDVGGGGGPQGSADPDQVGGGQVAELVAQLVGRGADQRVDLVDRLGPGLAGAEYRNPQHAQGFHVAVAGLGRAVRGPTQRGAGRADRVDRVGLTRQAPRLAVGSVDLDHHDVVGVQEPGQPRSVAAGPLHPDQGDLTERGQPPQQLAVSRSRGRERRRSQHPSDVVQRRRHVHIQMRIDTAGNPCHRCHVSLHPSPGTVDTAPAGTADKTATGLVSAGS
jgi:hypothetical protein